MRTAGVFPNYVRLPPAFGGEVGQSDLVHACLYLGEAAVSLDEFEEDQIELEANETALRQPGLDDEAVIALIRRDDYLKRRSRVHCRSFALALHQVRDALAQLLDVCPLPEVEAALHAFDDAFPILPAMRNSLAHAAERARRGPEIQNDLRQTYVWLGLYGFWQGTNFVVTPRAKDAEPCRLAVTDETLVTTTGILKSVIKSLTERSLQNRWPGEE